MYLEDLYDDELGAAPKRKIRKKVGKAFKAMATGGVSLTVSAAKKTKLGKKVSALAKKTKSKLKKAIAKPAKKSLVAKLSAAGMPQATPVARAVVDRVKSKKAGECKCKGELVKLVAGKLVAELSPPLNQANKMLAKAELQRKATYEHQKLMRDSEFRRRVLEFIGRKARSGNRSCQRTISILRG